MMIAVLLTTYNRKAKTILCLASLYRQQLPAGVQFSVHLTDDASADGTVEAIGEAFPEVIIYQGSGSLFWAGGMRNSWEKARSGQPDFYLLLNDDTELLPNAVASLLTAIAGEEGKTAPAIGIGTTLDKQTREISYGGQKLYSKYSVKSYNVFSEDRQVECDMANANIMLVPASIVEQIGILSDAYTHSIADFDYTLQARKAGFRVIVAAGVLGYCKDDHGKRWKSQKASLRERIAFLKSHKGLAYGEYMFFIRRHFPLYLPSVFVKLWMKTFFPVIWDVFKK